MRLEVAKVRVPLGAYSLKYGGVSESFAEASPPATIDADVREEGYASLEAYYQKIIEARAIKAGLVGGKGEAVRVEVLLKRYHYYENRAFEQVFWVLGVGILPLLGLPLKINTCGVDAVFSVKSGDFSKDYPYQLDDKIVEGVFYGRRWLGSVVGQVVDRFLADLAVDLAARAARPRPPPVGSHPPK
jgi:hypothetical protein